MANVRHSFEKKQVNPPLSGLYTLDEQALLFVSQLQPKFLSLFLLRSEREEN